MLADSLGCNLCFEFWLQSVGSAVRDGETREGTSVLGVLHGQGLSSYLGSGSHTSESMGR